MKEIRIGNTVEQCVERSDYPPENIKQILGNETIAVLGYGVQGRGQSLNMKDNGVNVIVGLRRRPRGWDLAQRRRLGARQDAVSAGRSRQARNDHPVPAFRRRPEGLLADAQAASDQGQGPVLLARLFSIVYKDQTGVVPPTDIDVILVAPKGSGTTVRRLFLEGKGINASYAVYQDATGRAQDRCLALGIAIGSGYLFETTFQKEVFSDLTGERGVLMGAIYGLWLAQYEVLREHGHSARQRRSTRRWRKRRRACIR